MSAAPTTRPLRRTARKNDENERRCSANRQEEPISPKSKTQEVESPPPPQLLHSTARGEGSIRGVACLGDEVFVVCRASREVEVYDVEKFALQRRLVVNDLRGPCDIVASEPNHAIYIADYTGYCVFRVELEKNASRWSVEDEPWSLSTSTQNNTVIVTCFLTSTLKEFTDGGYLVREIDLRETIRYPLHAIQLASGELAVCYVGQEHRVCTIDGSGRVTRSYGGRRGSTTGLINSPSYLAVDKEGNIFLTELGNNRVLLLNDELSCAKELIPVAHCGLQSAMRMCFIQERGLLLVGECNDGRLLAFQL